MTRRDVLAAVCVIILLLAVAGGCKELPKASTSTNSDQKANTTASTEDRSKSGATFSTEELSSSVTQEPDDTSGTATQSQKGITKAGVIEIVDGDTLKVRRLDGPDLPSSTIRLIGVDTPEVHGQTGPFGPETSRFTKRILQGRTVWLTKDVSETDRYTRSIRLAPETALRAVRKQCARTDVQCPARVAEGYAESSYYPPDVKYQELFRGLRRGERGNIDSVT